MFSRDRWALRFVDLFPLPRATALLPRRSNVPSGKHYPQLYSSFLIQSASMHGSCPARVAEAAGRVTVFSNCSGLHSVSAGQWKRLTSAIRFDNTFWHSVRKTNCKLWTCIQGLSLRNVQHWKKYLRRAPSFWCHAGVLSFVVLRACVKRVWSRPGTSFRRTISLDVLHWCGLVLLWMDERDSLQWGSRQWKEALHYVLLLQITWLWQRLSSHPISHCPPHYAAPPRGQSTLFPCSCNQIGCRKG